MSKPHFVLSVKENMARRLTPKQVAALKAKQRQSFNFIRDRAIDREFREELKEATARRKLSDADLRAMKRRDEEFEALRFGNLATTRRRNGFN